MFVHINTYSEKKIDLLTIDSFLKEFFHSAINILAGLQLKPFPNPDVRFAQIVFFAYSNLVLEGVSSRAKRSSFSLSGLPLERRMSPQNPAIKGGRSGKGSSEGFESAKFSPNDTTPSSLIYTLSSMLERQLFNELITLETI